MKTYVESARVIAWKDGGHPLIGRGAVVVEDDKVIDVAAAASSMPRARDRCINEAARRGCGNVVL